MAQRNITLTDTQQKYVRDNHNRMTVPEIALNLKVSKTTLYQNLRIMGIEMTRKYKERIPVDVVLEGHFNVKEHASWLI